MAFQIACQECGQTHSVSEELAGRQLTCRNCGGKLPVPGLIGYMAMKRETKRIFESLQVFLQQRASGK